MAGKFLRIFCAAAFAHAPFIAAFSSAAAAEEPFNDISVFRVNKEPARAFFVPFASAKNARKPLSAENPYKNSESAKIISGEWKFFFANSPAEVSPDFFRPGFNDSSWKTIEVPSSWQSFGYDDILYDNHTLQLFFDKNGKPLKGIYKEKGETLSQAARAPFIPEMHRQRGIYRSKFSLPKSWAGKEVFIRFNGVRTGFNLYINGEKVGYSEDSFTPAEFDISKYLKKGENSVAVEVYKFTTGAYFEMQDMPHTMGIIRDVILLARPKTYIKDYYAPAIFEGAGLGKAQIPVEVEIENKSGAEFSGELSCSLIDNSSGEERVLFAEKFSGGEGKTIKISKKVSASGFKLWSPDKPNLYTIVFDLKDSAGNELESAAADYAFRKFEIKGKTLYLNGKRFLIKGANRHDWSPDKGKACDFKWMLRDVELMARANINGVRTSHYPNDDRFYMLCSRYGITVLDEANLETHALRDDIPGDHPWFTPACVDRMRNMVIRDRNVPCVVIWSLGNENAWRFTKNHQAMFDFARSADPQRPIHSEVEMRDPLTIKNRRLNSPTDFVSGMYGGLPRIKWYQTDMQNETRPFIFCEYMHSMGNSTGNLREIFDAFRADESLNGGYLWDWVDQSVYLPCPENPSEKFLSYGADWKTVPSKGSFCLNGIIFADRTYSGKYLNVKSVHQNVQFKPLGSVSELEISNEFFDTNLNEFGLVLELSQNGKVYKKTNLPPFNLEPKKTGKLRLDLNPAEAPKLETGERGELFYTLKFVAKRDLPYAKKGEAAAEYQSKFYDAQTPSKPAEFGAFRVSEKGEFISASFLSRGQPVELKFDKKAAALVSLKYAGKDIISSALDFDISQAWIENLKSAMRDAEAYSLENLEAKNASVKILNGGKKIVCEKYFANADGDGFKSAITYEVLNSMLRVGASARKLNSTPENLALPRVGVRMGISKSLREVSYFGRGPMCNYVDRLDGAPVGLYSANVRDFLEEFPKLQDTGNREGVRWLALSNKKGNFGAVFASENSPLAMSLLPNSQAEMKRVLHAYQLPKDSDSELRIAWKVSGVGNGSHGPETFEKYKPNFKGEVSWRFWIIPFNSKFKGAHIPKILLSEAAVSNVNLKDESLAKKPDGVWISKGAKASYSSIDARYSPKDDAFTLGGGGAFAFHTLDEKEPFAVVDLGEVYDVCAVEIFNRSDNLYSRASAISLWISEDGKSWKKVWNSGVAKPRWIAEFEKPLRARMVKIRLDKSGILHLKGVKIYSPKNSQRP